MVDMKQVPPDQAEYKEYFEVKLKGGRPNKGLQQYLENDRKVLSFNILWKDDAYHGGNKHYVLNFYLADSQMEVKEVKVQNSGLDPFPLLLKKSKVPKEPVMTHYPGMSLRKEEYYSVDDLICGRQLKIFGRECFIYDCDDFTKQWYLARKGIEQKSFYMDTKKNRLMYNPTPPHTGFGSEEDSLGSVKALVPKPPRLDEAKMYKSDMHILRFSCKLVSTEPDDELRNFLVSFFCGDDTVQVYEECDKNAGRAGGKFLQKKKYKNPVTGTNYVETDFLIGKTIYLNGWRFQILSCDEYTEKYMADNWENFPDASAEFVLDKIRSGARAYPNLQEYAIALIKALDTNGDEVISFNEFTSGMEKMGIHLSDHQVHTLVRKFDNNKDGKISMEEFYNTLAQA